MSTQIHNLEQRVDRLDAELAAVRRDLCAIRDLKPSFTAPSTSPPPPAPTWAPPAVQAPAPRQAIAWEDLLAGRVMAWVGGSAVLVGLVLFLAMAVNRGWIGEEERTIMAGLASLLLVIGGARAYELRGRTEAALAATGAGIAGGFGTLAVATEVYGLVPPAVGLPAGLLLGAAAAILALRWRSRTIAVLGIAGGLLSPVLAGADLDAPVTLALLAIGYAGAVAVCSTLGWAWLGLLAFALVTPQWLYFAIDGGSLGFVIVFGLLGGIASVRLAGSPVASHLLLALNALFATVGGATVLDDPEPWLVTMAVAHLAAGAFVPASLRIATLGLGVILADVAFAELVDGVALPLAWAASAVGFALLSRRQEIAVLGLGGHLALAIVHVLTQEAPFGDLGGGGSAAGLVAVLAIAASCLVSGRLVGAGLRRTLDVTGLAALAYATALAFEGDALAVAWAAEAAALAALARHGAADALPAAAAFLAGACAVTLTVVAPLSALAVGLDDAGAATLALLAISAAAIPWAIAVAPLALLYLTSVLVVTAVDGQSGQLALSALWCAAGLGALAYGVVRDEGMVRGCALTLLAVATAKVFVVDLAALDSLARVGSFLVLGTLLLAGAFAWQRARPRIDEP